MIKYLDIIVFSLGIVAMGAGIALKDPAIALAVVGATTAATVIGIRIMSRKRLTTPRKESRTNEPT